MFLEEQESHILFELEMRLKFSEDLTQSAFEVLKLFELLTSIVDDSSDDSSSNSELFELFELSHEDKNKLSLSSILS